MVASKRFWGTILNLRRGLRGLAQAVLSKSGHPLTLNEDILKRWKEHFEGLLNLEKHVPFQEARLKGSATWGYWKGDFNRYSNIRFRRNNADSDW